MTAGAPGLPAAAGLSHAPADDAGLVFRAPWEAQAFAIVVSLHKRGAFTWSEWAAALSAEIKRAQDDGDPDLGDTYYRHWLAALEGLVLAKGLAGDGELRARRIELTARAAVLHTHPARRDPVHVSGPAPAEGA